MAGLVPRDQWHKAPALAASFAQAKADVERDPPTTWSINLVQKAFQKRNREILAPDTDKWEQFGVQFEAALDDLLAEMLIVNVRDYAEACGEVAAGLNTTSFDRELRNAT